jgi:hypothetical protein
MAVHVAMRIVITANLPIQEWVPIKLASYLFFGTPGADGPKANVVG